MAVCQAPKFVTFLPLLESGERTKLENSPNTDQYDSILTEPDQ